MSESQTITIQLPPEDWECLEAEAKRLSLSPDALAYTMLHERLAQVKLIINPLEALQHLREIGRKMPSIDAVKLARESREELEKRGTF